MARKTLVKTTHSFPSTALTMGMMRFPALEYITDACSTALNFPIFPSSVTSKKSTAWMAAAASRERSSPFTSSGVRSI